MKAVVIGSMNMDFTMDVDHLPSKGETVPAVRLRTSPGGKGLNQAVALARLGAEVLMVERWATTLQAKYSLAICLKTVFQISP